MNGVNSIRSESHRSTCRCSLLRAWSQIPEAFGSAVGDAAVRPGRSVPANEMGSWDQYDRCCGLICLDYSSLFRFT
jgi:hypothetical protein